MSNILKERTTIENKLTKNNYKIENFLGSGGQGEVYKASNGRKPYAVKWYYPHSATKEQKDILINLIKIGAPDERFLWPLELLEIKSNKEFGYVMPLRPPHFKSIVDLMKRRTEPSFYTILTACLYLADSFHKLHSRGLCYRDISFGNVFFDASCGDILICDNDNVAIEGKSKSGVLGTPRFMAPEIVRGEARPGVKTDLFSLSVLLFYMLILHHPLEGKQESSIKCLDLPAMNKLYGTNPIFIFDPHNNSNYPIQGYHSNALVFWPLYPEYIHKLFIKSFTEGLIDPSNGRVTESVWRKNLSKLRDSIVYCSFCGEQNFYDSERKDQICWSCNKVFHIPPKLKIEDKIIVLNKDTKLYEHHIDSDKTYEFNSVCALVVQNPDNPHIWGLKNLTKGYWDYTTAGGNTNRAAQNKSITISIGTKIQFGNCSGEFIK